MAEPLFENLAQACSKILGTSGLCWPGERLLNHATSSTPMLYEEEE